MRSFFISPMLALAPLALGLDDVHGQGDLGQSMGPVAFLWPEGRPWSAEADNTAPCGSVEGPTDRTDFPLRQGSVSLSIADDAWNVEFYLALSNDPTSMNDFQQQVVQDIAELEPGHQCYKLQNLPSNIAAGTPATLQMRYWAEYDGEHNGEEQSFYSCADIVFAEEATTGGCFNVTSDDFTLPAPDSSRPSEPASRPSAGGLSGGAKAGIAVSTIVASLSIVGAIAFFVFRRRKSETKATASLSKDMEEVSQA